MKDATLHLNFIADTGTLADFVVYRQSASPDAKQPAKEVQRYRLLDEKQERAEFWVSLSARAGFMPHTVRSSENLNLAKWALCSALQQKCLSLFSADFVRTFGHAFVREVAIKTLEVKEGHEEIIFQPYFLAMARRFGFLVDFHFRPKKDEPFSRRILQLSLSLDSQNRRNANFYTDKREKIALFLKSHFNDIFPLALSGQQTPSEFLRNFFPIDASLLAQKRYVVGQDQERSGPFVGIKEKGPWSGINHTPPLVFIFREQEREAARYLLRALKGTFSALNFDGFEKMFRATLRVSDKPVVVTDFSRSEMERALRAVEQFGEPVLPVLVLPHDQDEAAYATHKAIFASKGIPTQVCTTQTIADNYTLKWSIANLALQLFCKAGGKPWRIKSTDDHCLIIGIGQAHRYEQHGESRKIQKYFAFSILTDSSGLFQSVEMLGDSSDEKQYLEALRSNLKTLLIANSKKFTKVVLHTPFKLKQSEMRILEEEVQNAAGSATSCKFAVVKVNQHNRFFAFNEAVNSLIPYEGTYSRLGHDEFLVWFEGLFPDKPTASKAVPGPTHLKFLRVSHPDLIGDETILQDLLNLSGANWRGFNAKSTPVSVLYCRLVADLVSTFQEMKLPMPAIHNINPWFL
jgi:hypothetical protein